MQGRKWLVAGICLLAMLATTASASAARSVYPGNQDAISLRNGPAGWTADTSSEGLCVPVLLCPAITNSIRVARRARQRRIPRTPSSAA